MSTVGARGFGVERNFIIVPFDNLNSRLFFSAAEIAAFVD